MTLFSRAASASRFVKDVVEGRYRKEGERLEEGRKGTKGGTRHRAQTGRSCVGCILRESHSGGVVRKKGCGDGGGHVTMRHGLYRDMCIAQGVSALSIKDQRPRVFSILLWDLSFAHVLGTRIVDYTRLIVSLFMGFLFV